MRTRTTRRLVMPLHLVCLCALGSSADPAAPRVGEKIQLSHDVSLRVSAGDRFSTPALEGSVRSPAVPVVLNLRFDPKEESYTLLTCGPGKSCVTLTIGEVSIEAVAFISYKESDQASGRRPQTQSWGPSQFVMWSLHEASTLAFVFPVAADHVAQPKTLKLGLEMGGTPHSLVVEIGN